MAELKFYRSAAEPTGAQSGTIWFDSSKDIIKVRVGEAWESYGATIADGLESTEDGAITINLGADTEESKNFLDFEADGEGNQALAVRSMDTDATVTTEEITVMGGPLASLLTSVGIKTIPAGTDVQTLLMQLFCKEIYPYNATTDSWYMKDEATLGTQKKVGYQQPAFSNSVAAPTVTDFPSGEVEVGTLVQYNVSVAQTSSSATASKVSNLTWGYSAADDDSADSTSTTITKNWATAELNTDAYTLETTVDNGFGGVTIANVTGTHAALPSVSKQGVTVDAGTNKITWKITGASLKSSVDENPSVYMVSNLGKTDAAIKTNKIDAKTVECTQPTNSTNKSVTGVRYHFAGAKQGSVGQMMTLNSANIRSLGDKANSTAFDIVFPDKTSHVYIAVPVGKTLKEVKDVGAFGTDIVASFKKQNSDAAPIAVEGANGYTATNYNVYVYSPDSLLGANTYNVTIQ